MGKKHRRSKTPPPPARAEGLAPAHPRPRAGHEAPEPEPTEPEACHIPPEVVDASRRNFLKLGMGALGVLAALEAGGVSLLYLRSHSLSGVFGAIVTAGHIEDFPLGSVTEFPDARFFLVRTPEDGFLAVHSRCPHLGCTVMWVPEKNQFLCPCHASKFDIYGDHGNPPVSRALDVFAVSFKDGCVQVDTTQPSQRNTYSPDQLARV